MIHNPLTVQHSSRGFTLIELLVVVAIIAVLAAMLLPALKNAREKGKQAVCMNNLRQIHQGFAMYATDWEDYIPPVGGWAYPHGPWWNLLGRAGYFGSSEPLSGTGLPRWKVLSCPSEDNRTQSIVKERYYDYQYCGGSYVMNLSVTYVTINNFGGGFRKSFFKGPEDGKHGEAPFVTDCQDIGDGWAIPFFLDIDNPGKWDYVGGFTGYYHAFRHSGRRANMLYMDGHVAAVRHVNDGGGPNWKYLWSYDPP